MSTIINDNEIITDGEIKIQATDGKVLSLTAQNGMSDNKEITPLGKSELLDEIKNIDGSGSGIDADLFRGYAPDTLPAGIGVGQTWQDVTDNRSDGVTYTNTTGKPIMVGIRGYYNGTASDSLVVGYVDGNVVMRFACTYEIYGNFIVPNGSTYKVDKGSNATIANWWELR